MFINILLLSPIFYNCVIRSLMLCAMCHVQCVVTTITAHKNLVACTAFNHRGNLLATASDKVCLFLLTSLREFRLLVFSVPMFCFLDSE